MKIVLDTNVLISGIFFSGPPNQILKAWQEGKITIVASKDIIMKYQRVSHKLSEKFSLTDFEQILQLVSIYAEIVDTQGHEVAVCEDPDDNMFISCAIVSKSKVIVSGDKHLLKISGFQDIQVLKPRDFIDNYLK